VWVEVSLSDLKEIEGKGWIESIVVMLILAGKCK
jgi:hypothetical protein